MDVSNFEIQASGCTNCFEMKSIACKLMHILNMKIRPFLAVRNCYLRTFQAAVHGSVWKPSLPWIVWIKEQY